MKVWERRNMRRTKKGCTATIILLQMTHIRKSIGICLLIGKPPIRPSYRCSILAGSRLQEEPWSKAWTGWSAGCYDYLCRSGFTGRHPVGISTASGSHKDRGKPGQIGPLLLDLPLPSYRRHLHLSFFKGSPHSHLLHPRLFTPPPYMVIIQWREVFL